ncbi:MAG TPA: aldehyde dehydrogenase family protein, partial [Steroidobacteraceae bacterium]|nr:aldehyde dehydrogenase family protein [Steroidobacteraceae bacterium]
MNIRSISPVDGSVYAERTVATLAQIGQTLQRARAAQRTWREVPIAERAAIVGRFCGEFERRGTAIATGLSWQMGRPIRFAPSEVRGTLERARYMTGVAATALADVDPGAKSGFR